MQFELDRFGGEAPPLGPLEDPFQSVEIGQLDIGDTVGRVEFEAERVDQVTRPRDAGPMLDPGVEERPEPGLPVRPPRNGAAQRPGDRDGIGDVVFERRCRYAGGEGLVGDPAPGCPLG